jgi:hypothetical protein
MTEKEIGEALISWSNYFHQRNIFSNLFRILGWWIIKILVALESAVDHIASEMLNLLNLYHYAPIQNFITTYQPIFLSIAVIFVAVAIISMMKSKSAEFERFMGNVLIVGAMFIIFPTVLSTSTDVTKNLSNYIKEGGHATSATVKSNIADLLYVGTTYDFHIQNFNDGKQIAGAGIGWAVEKARDGNDSPKNTLTLNENNNVNKDHLQMIDVNEVVDVTNGFFGKEDSKQAGLTDNAKKLFQYYPFQYYHAENGKTELTAQKIHEYKLTPFLTEYYYRYDVNFGTIIFYLVLKLIVIFILVIKLAQLCYEILFMSLSATPIAMIDVKSGKRFWELVNKFFGTLGAIVMTFIMQVIFNNSFIFIDNMWSMDLSTNPMQFMLNVIAKVALAFFVIDGPNFFQSIFGVDAGLSSATRTLMGLNQGKQLAGSALHVLSKTGQVTFGGAKKGLGLLNQTQDKVSGGVGSFVQGLDDKIHSKASDSFDDEADKGINENAPIPETGELNDSQALGVAEQTADGFEQTPDTSDDVSQAFGMGEVASEQLDLFDSPQASVESTALQGASAIGGKALQASDGFEQTPNTSDDVSQAFGMGEVADEQLDFDSLQASAEPTALQGTSAIGGKAVQSPDGSRQAQPKVGTDSLSPNHLARGAKTGASAIGGKAVQSPDGSRQTQPKVGRTQAQAERVANTIGGTALKANDGSYRVHPNQALTNHSETKVPPRPVSQAVHDVSQAGVSPSSLETKPSSPQSPSRSTTSSQARTGQAPIPPSVSARPVSQAVHDVPQAGVSPSSVETKPSSPQSPSRSTTSSQARTGQAPIPPRKTTTPLNHYQRPREINFNHASQEKGFLNNGNQDTHED